MRELIERRSLYGKTWELGPGKFRLQRSTGPVHYLDAYGHWQDIELKPERIGSEVVQHRCLYVGSLSARKVDLFYRSRVHGSASVRLVALDGRPVPEFYGEPEIEGNAVFYRELVPGLDVEVQFWRGRVAFCKHLKSEVAPRRLTWEVVEHTEERSFKVARRTLGWDAGHPAALANRRRWAILEHEVRPLPDGRRGFLMDEVFTGRVQDVVDRKTRRREPTSELAYPVTIDQDITEHIVDNADDVYDKWTSGSTFFDFLTGTNYGRVQAGTQYGKEYNSGFRFQTIALPAGATIDAAQLELYVQSRAHSGPGPEMALRLYGHESSDAPAFSSSAGQRPGDVSPITTAYAGPFNDGNIPSSGAWYLTCTSVIQEIIDDAPAWASGNDMRLALRQVQTGCSDYFHLVNIADFYHGSDPEAVLTIDYTLGGAEPEVVEYARRPNPLLRM